MLEEYAADLADGAAFCGSEYLFNQHRTNSLTSFSLRIPNYSSYPME